MRWSSRLLTAGLGLGFVHLASFGCASTSELDEGFGELPDAEGAEGGEGGAARPGEGGGGGGGTPDGSARPTDAAVPSDAATDAGGAPAGFPCTDDAGCASGQCKGVVPGAGKLCVAPCTAQTPCGDNFFCDPETPGATSGFCVPRSPAHCKTCAQTSECGGLSERCGTAAGDAVKACHVDCSLAGDAACPSDYTCQQTTLDGVAAKVCRPAGGISCLDSLGGFCDRVATPQNCVRTNVAGTCVAQRTCLAASNRFTSCAAPAPTCKLTCSTTDPAGCTTSYCADATSGPANCGTCGNACPGLNRANTNVGCVQPACSYSCKGETYDVDANKNTGCESTETKTGNHTANTEEKVGDRPCYDDSSDPNISGQITTDAELHENPAIPGFDAVTGSAPDYYVIRATGQSSPFNLCVNNVDLTLAVTVAAAQRNCFHLRVETNRNAYDCDTDSTGACRIAPGGTSHYDDETDMRVVVSKRNLSNCRAATSRGVASYTVKGHL